MQLNNEKLEEGPDCQRDGSGISGEMMCSPDGTAIYFSR